MGKALRGRGSKSERYTGVGYLDGLCVNVDLVFECYAFKQIQGSGVDVIILSGINLCHPAP